MKKVFLISVLIFSLCFMSCTKTGQEITGDKIQDIENITQNDENVQKLPEQNNENDDILPKTDALSEIQKISGTLKFSETQNDETANSFVLAIKDKDINALSQFCGGESRYFDFLSDTQIIEYVILPFEIQKENINVELGYYIDWASHYAVNLKYSSNTNNDLFDKGQGEKLFYLQIGEYSGFGYPVGAFVPFEKAQENMYSKDKLDMTLRFVDMFSESYAFRSLQEGRNDAEGFDFSEDVHFVTHLMADFTENYPPYSLNQINGFLGKTFEQNKGISTKDIPLWAQAREYELSLNLKDEFLYSNFDEQILGCSYGHGGLSVMYDVLEDEANDGSREVSVVYYSDFAKITKVKKVTFHFDESGEYPLLLGVEVENFNSNKIASMSF